MVKTGNHTVFRAYDNDDDDKDDGRCRQSTMMNPNLTHIYVRDYLIVHIVMSFAAAVNRENGNLSLSLEIAARRYFSQSGY